MRHQVGKIEAPTAGTPCLQGIRTRYCDRHAGQAFQTFVDGEQDRIDFWPRA